MSTSVRIRGLAICIILFTLCAGSTPPAAQETKRESVLFSNGDWLYVGGSGPNNYTRIQDAVDNASDGDTVFVYTGTYVEYVIISKSIQLFGEDKNTTVISGFFAYTLSVLADGVNVSGFTIYTNGVRGEGIRLDACYTHFTNNIVDAPRDRFRVSGDNNTVSSNLIRNCYLFILGDGNLVFGNTIVNTYFGISLTGYATDNIIANNSLFSCGLLISDATVGTNSVTGNTVNGKPLMYREDDADLVLDGDAGQVILVRCTNITVHSQTIVNTTVGIQLWESSACVVTGNILAGNHYGIYLYGWNNKIDGNAITDGFYGVFLLGDNNSLSTNTITRNNGTALYIQKSTHNLIVQNIITEDSYGILMDYGCDDNTVLGNSLSYNQYAVRCFSGSSQTMLAENTITDNYDDGVDFTSSDHNTIQGNIISRNKGAGIDLSHCDYNLIVNTTLANNSDAGIRLEYSENNQLINATITHNQGGGIVVDDSAFNLVSRNSIMYHDQDGIRLAGDRNIISGNTIASNDHGVAVYGHKDNTITNNSFTLNKGCGIYLNASSGTTLAGNTISREQRGVYLVASSNNTVRSNTFLWNRRHALFEDCTNIWDHNYWGRPRMLPKLILGTRSDTATSPSLLIAIDWHPAFRPYSKESSSFQDTMGAAMNHLANVPRWFL